MIPSREERKTRVASLVDCYTGASLEIPEVAFELLTLVRDNLSWEDLLSFVKNLPEAIQQHDFTREQTLLAQSQLGDHQKAIAGLQELNTRRGDTPERRGLIGGRYKRLWRAAREERKEKGESEPGLQEQGYLDDAIENYRIGMKLDLNEYYCVSNLPGLLRSRGGPGDEEEAAFLDRLTVLATQRKIDRSEDDGWARSTLLGAAFRVADGTKVAMLTKEVAREGPAVWQLDSTLKDINDTIDTMPESETKQQLVKTRDQLAKLIK
jgi:tetratricopeptide (TPR) repeat protein